MKKIPLIMLLFLSLFLFGTKDVLAADVSQDSSLQILIDGNQLSPNVNPIISQNRVMVPFRAIAEALNLQVGWNADIQEIAVSGQGTTIKMNIGNQQAFKNNTPMWLDAPPVIVNERTMVPVRFIGEAFGCQVVWDAQQKRVSISTVPVPVEVMGYYALGDQATSSWQDLFGIDFPQTSTGNTDVVKQLALGWYTMDQDGNLITSSTSGWQRPEGWKDVLNAASEYKLHTEMCIQMGDSNARIRNLIRNDNARQLAVSNIMAEVSQYNGVNLDFEGLGYKDSPEELNQVRTDFTRFVDELAKSLHQSGKTLTLSLHAPNSEYPGYDYAALGGIADTIMIMAYDYGPKPEPLNLVEAAVKTAVAGVPSQKVLLGISISNENESSLANKIAITRQYGLKGIALWRLGLVSDEMWVLMRNNCVSSAVMSAN